MPVWWVGLCGIVFVAIGFFFNQGWASVAGVIMLISAGLGLLLGLLRRRS